ncbi:MAG: KpsF/GutQ family sugar-phosphate isomerase [Kiritimatiellae bacterium]|nr:KpsF/GutQ family sugar-phosphate isomerase [Kiritimatiellia bacterium]
MTETEMITRAAEVFDVEIEGLKRTRDSLGESFTDTVKMILATSAAGGIVVVSGVGKNLHIAEKMSAIFASTGIRSIVLNPVQAMHGDLGMVAAKDILIALSFSGESDELLKLIPAIRRHGLKVVSMTGKTDSSLARMSDIHLEIPCGREACPFGMAPTNSTTATMAMGDALAMVLIDAQKFAIEEYAMNHPAGAIGRALVMKVTDIMRTGDRLARVSPTSSVMDTLMAMTRAKSGSAVIVDDCGKLLGIFTDGDFRRRMSEGGDAAKMLAGEVSAVMTPSPMFVRDDVYAAELLKVFEKRRIDDLPVCDPSGHVVGVVDIQDLPKMKVL